jgi:Leucine-rich repeat (LRR) protein
MKNTNKLRLFILLIILESGFLLSSCGEHKGLNKEEDDIDENGVVYNNYIEFQDSTHLIIDYNITEDTSFENEILKISDTFSSIKNLEYHYGGLLVDKFPLDISKFKNLELFTFSGYIEEMPKEVCYLSKLKLIKFHSCSMKRIPEEIELLTNLEELFLSKNDLKGLPSGFCKLKNLKDLNLSANEIEELPDCFSTMTNLEFVNLCGNPIDSNILIKLNKTLKNTVIHYSLEY